jgi:hypothetical protein
LASLLDEPSSSSSITQGNSDQIASVLLRLFLAVGLAFVALAVTAVYVWHRYSLSYSVVDRTSESFSVNSLPAPQDSIETGLVRVAFESVYKNPNSRVTLRLLGIWTRIPEERVVKLDGAYRYCTLASSSGLSAMFFYYFPDYLLSLNDDTEFVRQRFTSSGYTLDKKIEVLVNGRKAALLEFLSPNRQDRMDLVLARKWPALYVLAMMGPQNCGAWQELKPQLAKSIELE